MKPVLQKILSWTLPPIVILGFFFSLQSWQKKKGHESSSFPSSPPILTPSFPPSLAPEKMGEFLDEESAQLQPASFQKDQKAMVSALKSEKIEDCQLIVQLEKRQDCEDQLRYPSFLRQNNLGLCKDLHSPLLQQKCMDNLHFQNAHHYKNPKQCERIEEELLKTRCQEELQVSLEPSDRPSESCDSIENPSQKILCQDENQLKMALSENQISFCNPIQNEPVKTQCLNTLRNNQIQMGKVETLSQTIQNSSRQSDLLKSCQLLVNQARQSCEDEVYFQLAFEQKNLLYCNQVKNEERKVRCRTDQQAGIDRYYFKRALHLKKSAECRLINNKALEKLCLDSIPNT